MQILLHYPFSPDEVDSFQQIATENGNHKVFHTTNDDEAAALASEVEVIMGYFKPRVCAEAKNLRWVQSFSAGMDKFLFPEIIEREKVVVTNMAGKYAAQGAEHAWALLLALARGLPLALRNKDQHQWQGGSVVALTGATLGIIGMGGFGLEIVKRARGYNMTILALDALRTQAPEGVSELKPSNSDNLHDLLMRADAVLLACPLTPETHHLIGANELAIMKPSAYLVNVTRGGIIDEDALVSALEKEQIAGAALDVVEHEPLPADSPLWDAPNLILTPHRAGASQHRHNDINRFFQENLRCYLQGKPLHNVIDKRRGF